MSVTDATVRIRLLRIAVTIRSLRVPDDLAEVLEQLPVGRQREVEARRLERGPWLPSAR